MKKKSLFLLLVACLTYVSCGYLDPHQEMLKDFTRNIQGGNGTSTSQSAIVFDNAGQSGVPSLQFSSDEGNGSISFTSSYDWTASVAYSSETKAGDQDAGWMTLSEYSGKSGKNEVYVKVNQNANYSNRTAVVTFKVPRTTTNSSYEVKVTQLQKNAILVPTDSIKLGSKDTVVSFNVLANVPVTVDIPEKDASWISVADTKGLVAEGVQLYVSENKGADVRTSVITIGNEQSGVSQKITVAQMGINKFVYFTAKWDGATVALKKEGNAPAVNLVYSTDGFSWNPYIVDTEITLANEGDKVYFKAGEGGNTKFSSGTYDYHHFVDSGVDVAGDISYLLDPDSTDKIEEKYAFANLFSGSLITSAGDLLLPFTKLSGFCYYQMFYSCYNLRVVPELPATTLAEFCYREMFSKCRNLRNAPKLPATKLAPNCYTMMFKGCSNMRVAPELPATELAYGCYNAMFSSCVELTDAPKLPAMKMETMCYYTMFSGCSSLKNAPELPATELAVDCYGYMFFNNGLTVAPVLPATSLATRCYNAMFMSCINLSSVTMLATNVSASNCLVDWLKDAGTDASVTSRTLTINSSLDPHAKDGAVKTIKDASIGWDITNGTTTWRPSLFSVSTTTKVCFSLGNMYYDGSTFQFEANQYSSATKWDSKHVSHFYWSKTGVVSTSETYSDGSRAVGDVFYTNNSEDQTQPNFAFTVSGQRGIWRTLTCDEWQYLLEGRTNAADKVGYATVAGVVGLIILPDTFVDPKTNTAIGATDGAFVPKSTTAWTSNIYTVGDDWNAMESAGAVFLPAAGCRWENNDFDDYGIYGNYWSSTCKYDYAAYYLTFKSTEINPEGSMSRGAGFSVRLVSTVK